MSKDKVNYCEWCSKATPLGKTTQAVSPILEFIEDKIDLIGREDIWGIHGDWSMVDIDSDLEAELLIYDEMMNNIKKRIICEVCLRQDDKMYTKYYSGMMGEVRFDSDDPDDEDHYIIELE
jgi:hypothetical protein|tara:strand:- start:1030 stop:1392 length:363 start_codon:yes stop_codon:yes gene_type:complete